MELKLQITFHPVTTLVVGVSGSYLAEIVLFEEPTDCYTSNSILIWGYVLPYLFDYRYHFSKTSFRSSNISHIQYSHLLNNIELRGVLLSILLKRPQLPTRVHLK